MQSLGGHTDDDRVVAGKNDVDQQHFERGLQQRAIHYRTLLWSVASPWE
jgi:hypothetical protein